MILENCYECLKPVDDAEWIDNWGSCNECFNKHLEAYYESQNQLRENIPTD